MEDNMAALKAAISKKIDNKIEQFFSEKIKNLKQTSSKEAIELTHEIEKIELSLFEEECKNNPQSVSVIFKAMGLDNFDSKTLSKQRKKSISDKIIDFSLGAILGLLGASTLLPYLAAHYC